VSDQHGATAAEPSGSPPTADAPGPAGPSIAPRRVDLPPTPPTRPLSASEQVAAEQAARAAEARAATVAAAAPAPVISAPTAEAVAAATAGTTTVARPPLSPPLEPAAAPPVPVPAPAPVPVARPVAPRRPSRTLPPGETAAPEDRSDRRRLSRREQKQLGRLRARKVRRVVRHIEPWSVFKLSLLFYICLYITLEVAGLLLWNLAVSAGTIDNIIDFVNDLGGGELTIDGSVIFRASVIAGGVLVIAGSLFNVLLAVLFNLISDLVGGIRVTVIEEENVRYAPATRPTPGPGR
jgi:hypothetical protein